MKNYWELQYRKEIDDEIVTLRIDYSDFTDALNAFNLLVEHHVVGIIVYSHISGYPVTPVLAFNNTWDDNFINEPSWVE